MKYAGIKVPSITLAITLMSVVLIPVMTAQLSWSRENVEAPFPVARLFFQLNDTDEDIGIHLLVDGEPWKTA